MERLLIDTFDGLLVSVNVVPNSLILFTLMMEAIPYSEPSVLTGDTWRHVLENDILHVKFEVFTAVTMKNGVFWNVTPCGSSKNRSFGGT
jgi:hypothetical protein